MLSHFELFACIIAMYPCMYGDIISVIRATSCSPQVLCQAIAVVLHYFYLVSFMWMLMEGVVLYVVLVRVFVKRQKLYMAGFTIFSYGKQLHRVDS